MFDFNLPPFAILHADLAKVGHYDCAGRQLELEVGSQGAYDFSKGQLAGHVAQEASEFTPHWEYEAY